MDRNGETLNEYGCNGHWSILSLGGYYGLSVDTSIGHLDACGIMWILYRKWE